MLVRPCSVHDDAGAVGFNADVLQADALSVGAAADREQHLVGGDFNLVCRRALQQMTLPVSTARHLWLSRKVTPFFSQLLLEQRADFAVGRAGDVIEHLDHGDLRACGGVIGDHF